MYETKACAMSVVYAKFHFMFGRPPLQKHMIKQCGKLKFAQIKGSLV